MAGQGAARLADNCDSLLHPPSRSQDTEGAIHLRAQLTYSPRPSQHILTNRKEEQSLVSHFNAMKWLRVGKLRELLLLKLLTVLLKL